MLSLIIWLLNKFFQLINIYWTIIISVFFLLLFMNWMWFFNLFQQNCFILWEYSNLFFHGWEFLIFDTKKINSNKIIFLLLFLHSILFYFLFIFFPIHIEFQSFVTFDDRWVKTLWFHIHTHTPCHSNWTISFSQ